MNEIDLDELSTSSSSFGIPTPVRDTREHYERRRAIYCIFASILFERIAYNVLTVDLALESDSNEQSYPGFLKPPFGTLIFTGTTNIFTLIFAAISDWKIGRSKIILFGFSLSIIGYSLATLFTILKLKIGANNEKDEQSGEMFSILIALMLLIISIGASALQLTLVVFGAEQIQESKKTSRFFEKYVIIMNTSAVIAMLPVFIISNNNNNKNLYYIVYVIATVSVLFSTLIFILGQRYYIHIKPYDSVLSKCIPVIIVAFRTWRKYRKDERLRIVSRSNSYPSDSANSSHPLLEPQLIPEEVQSPKFLDFAKAENNGKYPARIVNDVKSLGCAIVVFILLIPYWLIYKQFNSTFRQQAQGMRGTDDLTSEIVVSLADPLTIIIGIVLMVAFMYKYFRSRPWLLTLLTKFIIGMFFGIVTMLIAGIVELVRRHPWTKKSRLCLNDCCKEDFKSNMTIYWQLPQVITMGLSELFIIVASYEFAYFAAPRSGQSLFMSLRSFSIGIASILNIAYITCFQTSVHDFDFSCYSDNAPWRFYCYFFILAGIQFVFIIIFILCQRKFHIIRFNRQQIEPNQGLQQFYASFFRQQ